jgi:hypothetical protein
VTHLTVSVVPADTSGLDEPLLGFDDESEAHRTAAGRGSSTRDSHGSGSRALVPYSINAYDWADLIRGIVSNAVTGLRGLASACSATKNLRDRHAPVTTFMLRRRQCY